MAYDLEEQDQIDAFKAYWKKYGNTVLTAVTVLLFAFAAYRGYNYLQDKKSAEAVALYEQFREANGKNDLAKAKGFAGQIFEKYSDTAYSNMAAVLMAKMYFDGNDMKSAKATLQSVVDKSADEEYKHIAKVRLAGILLDEKAYDEGLKVLATDPPSKYLGVYADRRGDLLLGAGKIVEAKASYKIAIEKLEGNSPLKRVVQLKLDSLGE
jgi:predicted negative regulator of RcsB-dependent stress response